MADPISMVVLGAVVGGAAGKFVEKAWDSGEKWITTYFANHREKAQQKAKENASKFVEKLGHEVKQLEMNKEVAKEKIEDAQDQPDFSILLQQALIASSQTENESKHSVLARIVSERLQTDNESLLALTSRIACDVVPNLTDCQMRILGLSANIWSITPSKDIDEQAYNGWLSAHLLPYKDLRIGRLDFAHLDALSCGKCQLIANNLAHVLSHKNNGKFDYSSFSEGEVGKAIVDLWNRNFGGKLSTFTLTTIGKLIGILVSDHLMSTRTNLSEWNNP